MQGKERKKKPQPKKGQWCPPKYDESYVLRAYDAAKQGFGQRRICQLLKIHRETYDSWMKKHPEFAHAVKSGKEYRNGEGKSLREYIYRMLPDDLKELWDKINAIDYAHRTKDKVDALLANQGKLARQHLFLHALVQTNFNPSEACRMVGISKYTLDDWLNDQRFGLLINEMNWHKKNFFEGQLIKLVERGEAAAVLFVNKTMNRDRGYGEKVDVKHEHSHLHAHAAVDVTALLGKLDVDTRRKLLEVMREQKALPAAPNGPVVDAEVLGIKDLKEVSNEGD